MTNKLTRTPVPQADSINILVVGARNVGKSGKYFKKVFLCVLLPVIYYQYVFDLEPIDFFRIMSNFELQLACFFLIR